jgi:hypothetical protein
MEIVANSPPVGAESALLSPTLEPHVLLVPTPGLKKQTEPHFIEVGGGTDQVLNPQDKMKVQPMLVLMSTKTVKILRETQWSTLREKREALALAKYIEISTRLWDCFDIKRTLQSQENLHFAPVFSLDARVRYANEIAAYFAAANWIKGYEIVGTTLPAVRMIASTFPLLVAAVRARRWHRQRLQAAVYLDRHCRELVQHSARQSPHLLGRRVLGNASLVRDCRRAGRCVVVRSRLSAALDGRHEQCQSRCE